MHKNDCQIFAGYLDWWTGLQWGDKGQMGGTIPTFGNPGTFVWTDEMEREYHKVWKTMLEQICLTPYNPDLTRHRLKIDGASTKGIGFVL